MISYVKWKKKFRLSALDELDYCPVPEEVPGVVVQIFDGVNLTTKEFSAEQMKMIVALAKSENKSLYQVMIEITPEGDLD